MTTDLCIADTQAVERLQEKMEELEDAMHFSAIDALLEGASVTGHHLGGWTDRQGKVCALQAMIIGARARGMI